MLQRALLDHFKESTWRDRPPARPSAHGFDGHGEHVSRTALRAYQLLAATVLFELFAQAPYLRVDGALVDLVVVHVRHAEELLPREHALRRGEKHGKQVELGIPELDRFTLRRLQAPDPNVQFPAGEAVGAYFRQPLRDRFVGTGTAQQCANAREQLARRERLGQV